MLHAVIMAGGSGTRFWPASRDQTPKQLFNLAGEQTMIQATVNRLGQMVPPERVLILTNQRLVDPIATQLPQLPAESIVGEPCKRDTAPCIGLRRRSWRNMIRMPRMVVMPADHVIGPRRSISAGDPAGCHAGRSPTGANRDLWHSSLLRRRIVRIH